MKKAQSKYQPTIGIECHVQLKTKTKLFAAVALAEFEAAPNSHVSQICFGMPGSLPVLNRQAVVLAVKAAQALNTEAQLFSKFDRKHYFYPDLPKGYQITQFDQPIVKGGWVEFKLDDQIHRIRINRAHLEEDAGKTIHPPGKDYSLVDLNRAGTPLLEIVSEPDMHSAQEARAYAHELYLLMRYAEVSDADLYQGNMRFDVNVSLSDQPDKLGTRAEIKNLNSFRSVEKSVEYEIIRQTKLLDAGDPVIQETRGWNEAKQKTTSQRGKEEAHDYRYCPEPDLPPIELTKEFIDQVEKQTDLMPADLRRQLASLKLDESAVETLLDSIIGALFVIEVMKHVDVESARRVANWLTTDVQALIVAGKLSWPAAKLEADAFITLTKAAGDNKISSTGAKAVVVEMVVNGGQPMTIAEHKKLLQVSDESVIADLVTKILNENAQAAEDVKRGETKAIGFLVGQVMRESKGRPTLNWLNQ